MWEDDMNRVAELLESVLPAVWARAEWSDVGVRLDLIGALARPVYWRHKELGWIDGLGSAATSVDVIDVSRASVEVFATHVIWDLAAQQVFSLTKFKDEPLAARIILDSIYLLTRIADGDSRFPGCDELAKLCLDHIRLWSKLSRAELEALGFGEPVSWSAPEIEKDRTRYRF